MIKNKISFLIPTRNRYNHVCNTITSILENTSDINNIEILLRLDNDDVETIHNLKKKYENIPNVVKFFIGDRLLGYRSLHDYNYNLFTISEGEWLFCFSDDTIMNTKNFDLLFTPFEGKYLILNHQKNNTVLDTWFFPIINRRIIEDLGHFGKVYAIDGWFVTIGRVLNIIDFIDVEFNHLVGNGDFIDITHNDKINNPNPPYDWNYHINNPDGYIYQDIIKLKNIRGF